MNILLIYSRVQIAPTLSVDYCRMAGRKKKNIGRKPKNYEKKIQLIGKNPRGQPRKKSASCVPIVDRPMLSTAEANRQPIETIDRPTNLLTQITESITLPSQSWIMHPNDCKDVKICKLQDNEGRYKAIHSLTVASDGSWTLYAHDILIAQSHSPLLSTIPSTLTVPATQSLLSILDKAKICYGHPDEKFVDFVKARQGKLMKGSNEKLAVLDEFAPISQGSVTYDATVRSSAYQVLVTNGRCRPCIQARPSIRKQFFCWQARQDLTPSRHTNSSSHTNLRYMNQSLTQERLKHLRKRLVSAEHKISRLKAKIDSNVKSDGIEVSSELHTDLQSLIEEMSTEVKDKHPDDSFPYLFWNQQLQASKVSNHKQMRWHPTMIRWALYIRSKSTAGYDALRKAIRLPSTQTLHDYTHIYKPKVGFSKELDQQLLDEIKIDTLAEWQKYVGLIFDEMKVKEGIVYNKHSGEVIGFVNLGEVTNQLQEFERLCADDEGRVDTPRIAKYVNSFMVRGVFVPMTFPYAEFATAGISADELFPLVWEAIKRLELLGLKVIFITCDGASQNRKFFNMHNTTKDEITYKTLNIYSNDRRFIYFFIDTPHLLKTARNCFRNLLVMLE